MSIAPPPDPDLSALRSVFNELRARSGMTYDQLAEASGISRRTLLHISSGTYTGDFRTWLVLARVWQISLDDLVAPVWD
jgi:putative transcriptional regulator